MDGFNPRSRGGSDDGKLDRSSSQAAFQSALPRGERPSRQYQRSCAWRCFNPRSRGGSDLMKRFSRARDDVSIRAPAGGATAGRPLPIDQQAEVFQSALPRGERPGRALITAGGTAFQSALPRGERLPTAAPAAQQAPVSIRAPAGGATRLLRGGMRRPRQFQSALPRGERRRRRRFPLTTPKFQSALPRGERHGLAQ